MPDNVFGNRFYSYRQPAWHLLGFISEEGLGAVPAFSRAGVYHVYLENMQTISGLPVSARAIVRGVIPNEILTKEVLDTVGSEYELITPLQTCQIYDNCIERPVETLGALDKGRIFFISTLLAKTQIISDEVDQYLLIISPVISGAAEIRITGVRVVCKNTLVAAKNQTTQRYDVTHKNGAQSRLQDWLGYAFHRAESSLDRINELFTFLAKQVPSKEQVESVLQSAYPDPRPPVENAPDLVMRDRWARFEINREYQVRQRSLAESLFDGLGVGQDTKAAQGTAWGLWNAVTELEDYRGSEKSVYDEARARDALFGYRAVAKERAYVALMDLFGVPVE